MDLFGVEALQLDDRSFAGVANLSKVMIDANLNGTYEIRPLMGEVIREEGYPDGTRSALVTYTTRRVQTLPTKYMRVAMYMRTRITPSGLLFVAASIPIADFDAEGLRLIEMVDSVEPQAAAP